VIILAVAAGWTLPISPVQILWINMVTTVTLALALAFEPTEPGIMRRPPRRPDSPILGGYFLGRIAFISLLGGGATLAAFFGERAMGFSLEHARTVAVNTLVAVELFYLFNSRFLEASSLNWRRLLENRVALLAVGVLLLLQALFVYLPFMNRWFGTSPLGWRHWLVSLATGLAVFLLAEAEKAIYRRRRPLPG
jgi:magnesium-transporting ATPase (P-type)